jgi:hypothetical protein
MNIEDRLNKIKKASEEFYKDDEIRKQGMDVLRQTYIEHISTYKERIKDLYTVVKSLYYSCNHFKRFVESLSPYDRLGFIIESNLWGDDKIILGYYDGHTGDTLLSISEDVEIKCSPKMNNYYRYIWDKDFNRLEKRIYNYIDNEI